MGDKDNAKKDDFSFEVEERMKSLAIGIGLLNIRVHLLNKNIEGLERQQEENKKGLAELLEYQEQIKERRKLEAAESAALDKLLSGFNSGSGSEGEKSGVKDPDEHVKKMESASSSNDGLERQEEGSSGVDVAATADVSTSTNTEGGL